MNFLYLSRADVESLAIPMSQIIEAVEEGFLRKGLGETQMPPKTPINPRGAKTFLHAMPAYVGGPLDTASLKWVGGAEDNYLHNLPTITGLLILNDPDTMLPLAVMDCTWITMMRTGAANAVAMKYLGPKAPVLAGIIGCGVQGRSNALAMRTLYPTLRRINAFDTKPGAVAAFAAEITPLTGLEIIEVASAEAAVRDCDLVVTAGFMPPGAQPYIQDEWLKPGAMAAPVDYNSAWTAELCQNVDKIVTDDVAQMDYYRGTKGYFQGVPVPWELGDVVAGKKPGREREDERTMAMCQGIGIDDAVTAQLVYRMARERGVGVSLPL
jgi:ornithine cyclodeaminase/alanine dehydrogenase-like protein (mu-crystallin family)